MIEPMKSHVIAGVKATLPITIGVIPFGAVMGTVSADAGLTFLQSFLMNFFVFAGASQLAAINLMKSEAASLVVVATGLMINMRFLLYSAAFSPVVQRSHFLTKVFCAFHLTDQSYAVMSTRQDHFKSNKEAVQFYIGSALCMALMWHLSVGAGFIFGNFAPKELSLEFAIPLSFVALVVPTLKDRNYLFVAAFASGLSIFLYRLPFGSGLLVTAFVSLGLATYLTRKKRTA